MMIPRAAVTTACVGLLVSGLVGEPFASPVSNDARNIEMLSGCFAVTFRFVEDGVHDVFGEDYGLVDPVTEWIDLERDEQGRVALQHFSITADGRAVPHFHEIWTHRAEKGDWTQEIWSGTPTDEARELRYLCTVPWELNRWSCHAGKAPKPFRDDGAPFGFDRTEYTWLDRDNVLLVTENGWVHSQQNRKVDEADDLVSHELGWITYRRVDDARCDPAVRR